MNPDPMAAMINGLPDNSQQPQQQQQGGGFMTPQPNMFQNMQPQQQQPQMPQVQPQWQQVTPQPPAPGQMPQVPGVAPGGQQPMIPGMPMMPQVPMVPQFPSQQQPPQMPDWAQQMMQQIQQIQQPDGGGGNAAFNPSEPWSSTNRPKSWEEMRKAQETMATQKAQEIVTQTLQEQQQRQQQEQMAGQQANQQIDQTFDRLRLTGVLPPVQNPGDPNDPGKVAEQELLGWTLANGGKTPADMLYAVQPLLQQHQMGRYFDPKAGQMIQRRGQSAAAMAPIAGGMPVVGMMGQQPGPSQSQLAMGARDLGSLMQMGMDQIQ